MYIVWLIGLWAVINIFGLIWIVHHVLFSENYLPVVLFAPVWSICSNGVKVIDMSLAGQILITIFYAALMLPAVIMYYMLLIIVFIGLGISAIFVFIFRKRDKRR